MLINLLKRAYLKKYARFFILLLLLASPALAEEAAEEQENLCISCHLDMDGVAKDAAVQWKNSTHASAGVMCQDCHGGNPYDYAEAMDPAAGFKGKPERKDIAALCATCHADAAKMREHNLPSNQFKDYSKSIHASTEKGATCTDCHGKHSIRPVADPLSKVNRKNIVSTCASCHSSGEYMEKTGLPTNQEHLYLGSVHGKKYQEGDKGVPTCINCHSNHNIKSTSEDGLRIVCGNCHIDQLDAWGASPHKKWYGAGGPDCVSCHANHLIEKPTTSKFDSNRETDCLSCHAEGTAAMKLAGDMKAMILQAEILTKDATRSINEIESTSGSSFSTTHLEEEIEKIKTGNKEIKTLAHTLSKEEMAAKVKFIQKHAFTVIKETERMKSDITKRRIALVVAWLLFIVFSIAITKYVRGIRKE